MLPQILKLTKELISIRSTKENPALLKEVLERALAEVGEFTVERFERNGCPSALVYYGSRRPKRFKIILNGHLDVVPGRDEQYQPFEKDGRLYGRGASDMKASTAALLYVFKNMAAKVDYPLALQLVTDEEIGGYDGTKYQAEQGILADFVIAGEGTELNIKNETKGVIWLKIKTKGRTAHGAYLWKGENALWKLMRILERLEAEFPEIHKEAWATTVNLAKVSSTNETFNKVPDQAEAWLDARYIARDKESIVPALKKIAGKEAELDFLENEPEHYTAPDNPFIRKLADAVNGHFGNEKVKLLKGHGASDIRHYSAIGVAGVEFGPVGAGLHTDNEWVDTKFLSDYYEILASFLKSL